jgi:apolipoprotein N-acyltransferase
VAVILATALGLSLIVITIGACLALLRGQPLSVEGGRLLSSVLGGVLALLGGYLGFRAGRSGEPTPSARVDRVPGNEDPRLLG